ncbi:hypothetical protein PM082_018037 [Marasmius tenuissimus]|nr:hypothetical protein PM082_018037 [Marasmius tenuissimus]
MTVIVRDEASKEAAGISEQHTTDFGLIPIPRRLRYDPQKPFHFGIMLQLAFGFASTFTVANLYYCQPLLSMANIYLLRVNNRAKGFLQSSSQKHSKYLIRRYQMSRFWRSYAVGLLFLSPLGDLVRRRQLILALVIMSMGLTVGLAITNQIEVFIALSFLVGVFTVTPQVLIPLAADLAPPEKQASAISVVFAGLLLGVLIARVISGIIAQYVAWRVVYYLAIGVQGIVIVGSYLLLPDYPAKNSHLTYWEILSSMGKYCVTEPILVQAVLINIASSALFSSFWVTLTFLLGGDPYNYSTLVIGLFGLIGISGVAMGPIIGHIIDNLGAWYATLIGSIGTIVFLIVQLIGGGLHISAVVIAIVGIDLFRQTVQTSLAASIFSIAPEARARLNAVNIVGFFCGQVMGSSVGTKLYLEHGWRASAGVQVAWAGFAIFVLLMRGPHCSRYTWLGYEGGGEFKKSVDTRREKGEKGSDNSTGISENVEENWSFEDHTEARGPPMKV